MARARSGGGGSIWGLVLFGAGFFICLILAIVFYTRVETAEQAAAQAQTELAGVQSSGDAANPQLAQLIDGVEGRTTVSRLLAVVAQRDDRVAQLEGEVGQLSVRLSGIEAERDTAQRGREAADARATREAQGRQRLADELRQEVRGLEQTVSDISAENDRLESLIDTSIQEVDRTYQSQITQLRQRLAAASGEVTERDRTIAELRDTVESLRGVTPESVAVTLADATVVAQIPEQNKVYFNLGRNQNLRLGMPFQVYDPDDLVKIEDPEAEGKAVVEVINLDAETAVGRVVSRKPRAVVNNGDTLVNVVYDPNRVLSFHVFGQYDLDADGDLDDNGADRVESLVRRFGGRLTDELGFATDYLVLGVPPELPVRPDDELDLILMQQYRVELDNFQSYQDLIARAGELDIPVLNQNRFLDLVGFFAR
ncbi:MAG: hypothetical protein AAF710_12450 [Planctomycetota bacterium]